MGRLSKEKEAEIFQLYMDSIKSGAEGIMETAKFVTTEGLWIGLGIDYFLVSGEIHSDSELLFAQREAIVKVFEMLNKLSTKDIPIIEDLNPFGLLNDFVQPLGAALSVTIDEPGPPEEKRVPITTRLNIPKSPGLWFLGIFEEEWEVDVPLGGVTKVIKQQPYYYPALPLPWRIMLALMLPGILRLIFAFLSSQLTKGSAFSQLL